MASDNLKKEDASNIANKLINKYPNTKIFLEALFKDVDVEIKVVGRKFEYPYGIIKNKLFSNYGSFMDYFIRKVVSNQFNTELDDDIVLIILKNPHIYFTPRVNCKFSDSEMKTHYDIYKDPKNRAMDILKSIKIVSMARPLFFHDRLPNSEVDTNNDVLLEVIQYFKKLPYSKVDTKCSVECKYYEGKIDFMFDQKVLYEIKTSKYLSLSRFEQKINVKSFYKLILYGFGYYKRTGKIIKCFKIYNPLLGYEYNIQLNDIDINDFERVIQADVKNNQIRM